MLPIMQLAMGTPRRGTKRDIQTAWLLQTDKPTHIHPRETAVRSFGPPSIISLPSRGRSVVGHFANRHNLVTLASGN